MSKLSKIISSIINHVPAIGMYALLLIINAFPCFPISSFPIKLDSSSMPISTLTTPASLSLFKE